ncbi:MAG: MATE family efflux transporter [Bacteroidota bacterium]
MPQKPNPPIQISLKEINRLAIPAILMGISEPVIALVDTALIGKLGTQQLAAVGIASSFYLLVVWILSQTLTAISAIVSKRYGINKLEEIKSLIPQAIVSNTILGLGFFVLTNLFIEEIFEFYNAQGQILEYCVDYYGIRSIGFPFTLATMLMFGVFRGLQNTSWAMTIAISGAVVNLVFDYALIFGVDSIIEPMGLKGAAWASLVAQVFMFLLSIIFLIRRTPFDLKFRFPITPEYKRLAGMSLDLFFRTIMLNLTFYLATRYATSYGDEVIAAHTIALNIWLFSSFFIDGYAHAGNAIGGKLLGEQKLQTLYHLGKKVNRIAIKIGLGLAVIYAIGYYQIGKVFTQDVTVLEQFQSVFWLVILMQPINASGFAYDGLYKGLGETKLLRNLLIGATLLGFTPMVVGFDYYSPGLLGIWIAFLVWMVIRSYWLVWDFRKRYSGSKS